MENPDLASDCEVETMSKESTVETEERTFVSSLYSFMKDRNTPIERIPHLGFKQINLWKIYKAVEKLGGYDSATARRLWKNVYDELGGSPGSTSAATCTRRHYERLLLPFERQLRGEEDKPLPPSKPRKQYKRSLDAKISKTEGKRKRTQSEKEMDSEARPESTSESLTATRLPSVTWPDRAHPEVPEPDTQSQSPSVYTQCSVQPVRSPCPWSISIASTAGEVISPLEKKKRMAQQASHHQPQPQSPSQDKGKDRPSVIHCSPPRDLAPPSGPSSEGSPLPLSSSSSSRSPSPYSISSDDCAALPVEKSSVTSKPKSPLVHSSNFTPVSGCRENGDPHSIKASRKDHRDPTVFSSQVKDTPQVNTRPLDTDSARGLNKDNLWSPVPKEKSRYATHQAPQAPPTAGATVKSIWVPGSTSSFTKVPPKTVVPLRPIPQPGYKLPLSRSNPHEDTMANAKRLNHMAPRLFNTEKKEKSRAVFPKPLTQSTLRFPMLPVSYLFPAYDRTGRDYRPSLPLLLPSQIRPPLSLPMYRHLTMGPDCTNPAFDPIPHAYPHSFPVWNPQPGYNLTGVNSHYPHRM